MINSKTETLGQLVICRDGQLDIEQLNSDTRALRKQQLHIAGRLAIEAVVASTYAVGRGMLAAYQHIYAEA